MFRKTIQVFLSGVLLITGGHLLLAQSLASGTSLSSGNSSAPSESTVGDYVNASSTSDVFASVSASVGQGTSSGRMQSGVPGGGGAAGGVGRSAIAPRGMVNLQGGRISAGGVAPAMDKHQPGNLPGSDAGTTRSYGTPAVGYSRRGLIRSNHSGFSEYGTSAGFSNRGAAASHTQSRHSKSSPHMPAAARYSNNFPDSTRGTALINPPDNSMQNPLDWHPGLNYEFADFEKMSFLHPSLSVAGGKKRLKRRTKARPRGSKLPASSVLFPNTLNEPLEESPLVQSLGSQ